MPLHIVHRDMSPPNVLITKYGEIKIVDFGLAKANSQLEKSEPGIIKGKFSLPRRPRRRWGRRSTPRTDIFAVGIILWELLAGQRLFLGDTDFQTVKKVQAAVVPQHLADQQEGARRSSRSIIDKALARDPAQRYQTARDLGLDLSKFMFKFGVPVSTFDIASLVQGAMKERQRASPDAGEHHRQADRGGAPRVHVAHRRQGRPGGGAKPIDTSTITGPLKPPAVAGSLVDVGSWIDEIAVGQKPDNDGSAPVSARSGLTEGNLAALEDDEPSSPRPAHARPSATPGRCRLRVSSHAPSRRSRSGRRRPRRRAAPRWACWWRWSSSWRPARRPGSPT